MTFRFFAWLLVSSFALHSFSTLAQTQSGSGLQALETLNRYRAAMGLSALVWSGTLTQTAKAHSQYLSSLQDRTILSKLAPDGTPEMHRERAGNANFTGVTLGDRTKHQGYRYGAGEQVVFNERDFSGAAVVDQLMTTVYHRSGLLNPAWSELGGAVDSPDAVLVLGESAIKSKIPPNWLAMFPSDQSTAPRIGFQNELPDPAPERAGQWLGLPISIHAAAGNRLTIQRFGLRNTADPSQWVAGKVLEHRIDNRIAQHEVFFLPTHPLRYGAQYEVQAELMVNLAPRKLVWRFQTAPNPFIVIPTQSVIEVMPGVAQLVDIQGMQGSMQWESSTIAPQGVSIEVKRLASEQIQITFPTSCNADCKANVVVQHQGPQPSTERREFVVSKAWLAARPIAELMPKELVAAAKNLALQPAARALAYGHEGGRWFWSTSAGAPTQGSAEQNAMSGCTQQGKQLAATKPCLLFVLP